MKKVFSVFNICVVLFSFCIGVVITRYEDRYGILTVAERDIFKNEEKLIPEFDKTAGKININIANTEELDRLPGVGEKLSERIVKYRETNGNFEVPEDIMKVSGIGESLYSEILEFICIY